MPDRIIRDELFQSDRFIDLPTDTDRIAYVGLAVVRADDFGNFEDHPRALFRFLHGFAQVKTEEAAATVMSHLLEADLVRSYTTEVDGKQKRYYHIPRGRPHRQYIVRKYPASPWDVKRELGKQRVVNRGLAKFQELAENPADISQPPAMHMSQGVGVGVGVGVGEKLEKQPTTEYVADSVDKSVENQDQVRLQVKTLADKLRSK